VHFADGVAAVVAADDNLFLAIILSQVPGATRRDTQRKGELADVHEAVGQTPPDNQRE
jgi:hypothetical protein